MILSQDFLKSAAADFQLKFAHCLSPGKLLHSSLINDLFIPVRANTEKKLNYVFAVETLHIIFFLIYRSEE